MQGPTQQLCQCPDSPGAANGLEPPPAEGVGVVDAFLGVAVGAFTGTTSPVAALPRLGATVDGAKEARMGLERHAVAIAQDAKAVRPVLALRGRALSGADLLPTWRLVGVTMRATQTTTWSRGRAGGIIAPGHERRWIEVLVAAVRGTERAGAALWQPRIVGGDLRGRIPPLHLPGHHWQCQCGAMGDTRTARLGVGGGGRMA